MELATRNRLQPRFSFGIQSKLQPIPRRKLRRNDRRSWFSAKIMKFPNPIETTDLYRLDGRLYDLSEENGVFTLQLRRSVRWERSIIAVLASVLVFGLFMASIWIDRDDLKASSADFLSGLAIRAYIQLWIMLQIQFTLGFVLAMKRGEIWKFDKNAAKVLCNATLITNFSKVRSVRAWRRGSRFFIALKLRFGQTAKLGFFGFSRSERAWRDDAAQIAEFLGVPLDIPAV